jgi:hypothetical protein
LRQKKRYVLAHYNSSSNALDAIKTKYAAMFGTADLEKTLLKVISDKDGFLILRCSLDCYRHLLETLDSLDGRFTTLNTSGTLKALRSRQDEIKKRFISRIDINTAQSKLSSG